MTASVDTLHAAVLRWYGDNARDLPWRRPGTGAWPVLVSEVMLQQTPVVRVEPAWWTWLRRWPTPAALAADSPGEAVRQWGRLGYPRRALRLHAAALACVRDHAGEVPTDLDALLALPGLGAYTARAVASFAHGQRHPVVDTNVRRVLRRALLGVDDSSPGTPSADLDLARPVVPADAELAARWAVAVMELGALVCTVRAPRCGGCPVADRCRWRQAGSPPYDGPVRRGKPFAGTDRQARGRIMAVLREAAGPLDPEALDAGWPEPVQRARALAGLVADGLAVTGAAGRLALPS